MQYNQIMDRALDIMESSGMNEKWLDLGSETGSQNRLNREYMDSIVLETRLIDSVWADTRTALFGVDIDTPIIASALASGRVLTTLKHESVAWFQEPAYLEEMARAIGVAGSMMGIGAVSVDELVRIASQGAPLYHIVKPKPDEQLIMEHLQKAVEVGCVAVGMDVTPVFGHKAWNENPAIDQSCSPKTSAQLEAFVSATDLPFVVKGVLSVQDAVKAERIGASAIVVSNHGGECIDYSIPILKILPKIKEAVPELTVIVDSGFRRGTDILKALALGADAVGIATPLVAGYVAAGRVGVQAMIEAVTEELRRTMSATGFSSVSEIDSSVLHFL